MFRPRVPHRDRTEAHLLPYRQVDRPAGYTLQRQSEAKIGSKHTNADLNFILPRFAGSPRGFAALPIIDGELRSATRQRLVHFGNHLDFAEPEFRRIRTPSGRFNPDSVSRPDSFEQSALTLSPAMVAHKHSNRLLHE